MTTDSKRLEVEAAIDDGAQEIDVVAETSENSRTAMMLTCCAKLRDLVEAADERTVESDPRNVACSRAKKKFARANSSLNPARISSNLDRLQHERRDDTRRATHARMRRPQVRREASGGIRDAKIALGMNQFWCTRLGTSASVAIVTGLGQHGELLIDQRLQRAP